MNEALLVKKIIRGEKRSLRLFFETYRPKIARYITTRVDDPLDGEEIVQEIFISGLQFLPSYSFKSSLFTWLLGIARHEVADYYRKKKIKTVLFSHLPFLEKLADQALGPEEEMIEAELKARVKRVFGRLTEGYRVVLRLKYIEGLSVSEIADRLGLSYKATESRLTRARFCFREVWATENKDLVADKNEKLPFKFKKDLFL